MDRLRVAIAAVALVIPAVVFALNASYRERGLVETYDIPAAIAFLIAAVLVWRRSVAALVAGPAIFTACWIIALVLTLQAVPLLRR